MKGIDSTPRRLAAILVGFALVVMVASTAQGRQFSVAQKGSKLNQGENQQELPVLGAYYSSLAWRPLPGYPTITATGSAPASITINPGLINQAGYFFATPIEDPGLPSYIQFSTGLGAIAPWTPNGVGLPGTWMSAGGGPPATFKPGPKASRPANFSWCPGADPPGGVNPACATVGTGPGIGTKPGFIKYEAGGEQFGGTMAVFNYGPFHWWTTFTSDPTLLVTKNNAGVDSGPIAAGLSYGNREDQTPNAVGDIVYANPVYTLTPNGGDGPLIADPGTFVTETPPAIVTNWGMPWTTGMVYVKVPFNPPFDPYTTITTTGSDNRTPLGEGTITMVAGGLYTSTQTSTAQRARFTLRVPEPSRYLMLASGVGLLALLGLGCRVSARRGARSA